MRTGGDHRNRRAGRQGLARLSTNSWPFGLHVCWWLGLGLWLGLWLESRPGGGRRGLSVRLSFDFGFSSGGSGDVSRGGRGCGGGCGGAGGQL